jgi:hypothetical protein
VEGKKEADGSPQKEPPAGLRRKQVNTYIGMIQDLFKKNGRLRHRTARVP